MPDEASCSTCAFLVDQRCFNPRNLTEEALPGEDDIRLKPFVQPWGMCPHYAFDHRREKPQILFQEE